MELSAASLPAPDRRWVGVGQTTTADARAAGRAAADQALAGRAAKLLIVFTTDGYDLDELVGGMA